MGTKDPSTFRVGDTGTIIFKFKHASYMCTKNARVLIREANTILGMGTITHVYPFEWKPPSTKTAKINKPDKNVEKHKNEFEITS